MMSDQKPQGRPGGPGPGAIPLAPRTGPLQGGPARTTPGPLQDQDHYYTEEEWRERLAAMAEEASRRKVAKAVQREARARARKYGLIARHHNKLARDRGSVAR